MSDIWNRLVALENYFVDRFNATGKEFTEVAFDQPGWTSRTWSSENYRRAHIAVADARNTKGLWMMHCCVFPHTDNTAPIFGYDVVAGANKITGCFHDFSSVGFPQHPLIEWFGNEASQLSWNKTRELPDWAKRIFSPHMIAAANVNSQEELEQILHMGKKNLDHYLDAVGETAGDCVDNVKGHNYYCENQKLNPHNPRVMSNLGLSDEAIKLFIEECMFPEIR